MNRDRFQRVVVTGVGTVTSWGEGREAFWRGICSPKTSIGGFERFDHSGYPTHVAAEVPEVRDEPRVRAGEHDSIADRFSIRAALEAAEHAGLPQDLSALRAAVFFGSSTGGMYESERFYDQVRRNTLRKADIRWVASQQVSGPGDAVARRLRVTGPVETISSACSSATLALGMALDAIREGSVEVALAGGSDSLCRITYGGFNSLRSVDENPCRPFRAERQGLSIGEGSAVLVLESLPSAEARGAVPLAELCGAGASCDAHHMTAPDPQGEGAARAVRQALHDAAVVPEAVDFINAHGTGTPLNDAAEARAFAAVFGERAGRIPVTATKSSVGHLLGSAGAIEAVATALSLHEQIVPPVSGPEEVDPEAPVRLVHGEPLATRLNVGVTLNLAFGGCNGALVFSRWSQA